MRPSSLPALAVCPRYKADPSGNAATQAGKDRHSILSAAISGDWKLPENLDEETREGLQWALDYIKITAPMSSHPIECEQRGSFTTDDFTVIEGTPDVVCGRVLFDLKWRHADYEAQMAAYACMICERGWESVEVHVLFAQPQKIVVYRWTHEEAAAIVNRIVAKAKESPSPVASDWCGWCDKRLTCPAVTKHINRVIEGRPDFDLETWHSSDITSADEMGKALKIARIVKDWSESVEHHAKEMAIKHGRIPTGFKLQCRKGNRFITSVECAFSASDLPQAPFLSACEVKLSKLTEVYAEVKGLKKAPAERELESKLGDLVQRKPPTQSLIAE